MAVRIITVDRDTAEVFAVSLEDNVFVYPDTIRVDTERLTVELHGDILMGDEWIHGDVELHLCFYYAEGEERDKAIEILNGIEDLAGVRALLPPTFGYRIFPEEEER